ncbi:hypothetical protein HWV62_33293 [Athelia sp. TMB]|nr:hypothetical protein HWV62_33293 [Athelia sp. TMB]
MPASEAPILNLQKRSRWGPPVKSIAYSTVPAASTSLIQNAKNTPQWPIEAQERPDLAVQFDRHTEVVYKTGTETTTSPRELLESLKQSPIFAAMVNPIGTKDTSRTGVIGISTDMAEGLALNANKSSDLVPSPSSTAKVLKSSSATSSTSAADVDIILTTPESPIITPSDSQPIFKLKSVPMPLPSAQVDAPLAYEHCRHLIAPLALQLAQARGSNSSEHFDGARAEKDMLVLMDDKLCAEFVGLAKEVQAELGAKDGNGRRGADNTVAGVKRSRQESEDSDIPTRIHNAPSVQTAVPLIPSGKVPPRAPRAMRQAPIGSPSTVTTELAISTARTSQPPSGNDKSTIAPLGSRHPGSSHTGDKVSVDSDLQSNRYRHDSESRARSKPMRSRSREGDHPSSPEPGQVDDASSPRNSRLDAEEMALRALPMRSQPHHGGQHRQSTEASTDPYSLPARFASDQRYRHRRPSREFEANRDHKHSRHEFRQQSKEPGEVDSSPIKSLDNEEGGEAHDHVSKFPASSNILPRFASPLRMSLPTPPLTKSKSRSVSPRIVYEREARTPGYQQDQRRDHFPRLWLARIGLPQIDVLEVEFEIDTETALSCQLNAPFPVSMRLLCLPTATVQGEYEMVEASAPPWTVANAMRSIPTEWPAPGSLVIQMHVDNTWSRSWLPEDLVGLYLFHLRYCLIHRPSIQQPETPPLDITLHIRPGANRLRFIHLSDLSAYTFLVHSAPAAVSKRTSMPRLDPVLPVTPTTMMPDQRLDDSEWDEYLIHNSGKATRTPLFDISGTTVVVEH